MRLSELMQLIRTAFEAVPYVNSFYEGDVYETWNNKEVKYTSADVALETIETAENVKSYSFIIYVADRLLEDASNATQCWDSSEVAINSALNRIENLGNIDILSIETSKTFTPFSQKFADNVAGVYVRVKINIKNDLNICNE